MRNAVNPTGADKPAGTGFDPSTWGGQARLLAKNDAEARALFWAILLAAADVVIVWAALRFGWAQTRDVLSGDGLMVLVVQAGAVALLWVVTYTRALRDDTEQVRQTTWQRELAEGRDIDGDSHVGPPPSVGHVLPIGSGPRKQEVILPDLDPPKRLEALPGFPTDPVVTPNDVVFILTNSVGDGLAFATWTGRRLPSGAEIQRDTWTAILDGLLAWQFATASSTANGRRIVALRSDIDVEDMIKHIKTAVEQPVRAVQ